MRVDVVRPRDLGGTELARWRELQLRDPAADHAFLSAGFALALDRVRSDTRVAVLSDGEGVAGFLGFHDVGGGLGQPLGLGLADVNGPVLEPGRAPPDPRELVSQCGLRRWSFDHLLLAGPAWRRWAHAVSASPLLDLAAGAQAYRAALHERSASLLATAARKRRRLERELGPVRLDSDSGVEALARLYDWKSAQYSRTGQWDRFAVPWIRELVEQLAGQDEPTCRGSLVALRAGEQTVAVHLGLRSRSRLAWWFPAYDPGVGRYSPGTAMLLELAETAAASGVTAIDLGKGDEEYKVRLGTGALEVAEGWVPASAVASASWQARRLSLAARSRTPAVVKRARRRMAGTG